MMFLKLWLETTYLLKSRFPEPLSHVCVNIFIMNKWPLTRNNTASIQNFITSECLKARWAWLCPFLGVSQGPNECLSRRHPVWRLCGENVVHAYSSYSGYWQNSTPGYPTADGSSLLLEAMHLLPIWLSPSWSHWWHVESLLTLEFPWILLLSVHQRNPCALEGLVQLLRPTQIT